MPVNIKARARVGISRFSKPKWVANMTCEASGERVTMFYQKVVIILLTGYMLFQLRLETHRNQSLVDKLMKTNDRQLERTNFHNRIFTGQRYRGINYIINRNILTLVEIERMSKS